MVPVKMMLQSEPLGGFQGRMLGWRPSRSTWAASHSMGSLFACSPLEGVVQSVWGEGRSGPGQLGEPQGRSPSPECSLPPQLPTRHKEAFMGWCGEN